VRRALFGLVGHCAKVLLLVLEPKVNRSASTGSRRAAKDWATGSIGVRDEISGAALAG
jgi:hypothetical protein